jgi:hypothetical protein
MAGGLNPNLNNDVFPISFSFRDAKGQTSSMRFYLYNGGTASAGQAAQTALLNALDGTGPSTQVITNAALESYRGLTGGVGRLAYGANAEYPAITDKAQLTFQDAKGRLHNWLLPAPNLSIFEADGDTVNPANISDLIAAIVSTGGAGNAFVAGKDGALSFIANYIAGVRLRKRTRYRVHKTVLTPSLTPSVPAV